MKYLKRFLLIIIILPLVLIITAGILLFSVDPNTFKPMIEEQLSAQNIDAKFDGDLSWTFFPNLSLNLGSLSIAQKGETTPLAKLGGASISLKVKPLFQRQIKFNTLSLTDTTVNLIETRKGTNWDSIASDNAEEPVEEDTTTDDSSFEIDKIIIDKINIKNLNATYQNKVLNETHKVTNLNLNIVNFNDEGKPIDISLDTIASAHEQPSIKLALSSQLIASLEKSNAKLNDLKLTISPASGGEKVVTKGQTTVNWAQDVTAKGNIAVESFNVEKLLAQLNMAELDLVEKSENLSFSTAFDYDSKNAKLDDLKLSLGNFNLTGNTNAQLEPLKVKANFMGNKLVVHDIIPSSEDTEEIETTESAEPLPLETLRDLDIDIKFGLEAIQYDQHTFNQASMDIKGKDGLIKLNEFKGNIYEGSLVSNGQFDARSSMPTFNLKTVLNKINIGQITTAFTDKITVKGSGDSTLNLASKGVTSTALMDNMEATTSFEIPNLLINALNITEQFCKAVAFTDKSKITKTDWEQVTKFAPIKLNARYANNEVKLENLGASIEKLQANAKGQLNIDTGEFRFPFDLSLGEFAKGIEGCTSASEKWRGRFLPLVCKGNLATVDAKTCLPDTKRLGDILKNQAKEKLNAKKAELKAELKQKEDAAKAKLNAKKLKLQNELDAKKEAQRQALNKKKEEQKDKVDAKAKEQLDKLINDKTKNKLKGLFK